MRARGAALRSPRFAGRALVDEIAFPRAGGPRGGVPRFAPPHASTRGFSRPRRRFVAAVLACWVLVMVLVLLRGSLARRAERFPGELTELTLW